MKRSKNICINIKGRLFSRNRPLVMGIINVTPDSFYASSRAAVDSVKGAAARHLADGADMLDLGGYSSRPGADLVSEEEELSRLLPAVEIIKSSFPDVPLSIDTFRANVAKKCISAGADIINDIGGGNLDSGMFDTVAELNVPYILMHMRGTPSTMQTLTEYNNVAADILEDLAFKVDGLHQRGVKDVIVDPGFGFAKTIDQNYELLSNLRLFEALDCPILVGLSRKSMICKELKIQPTEALNGTSALNMAALMNGADILRVHDSKQATEVVKLFEAMRRNANLQPNTITTTQYSHII